MKRKTSKPMATSNTPRAQRAGAALRKAGIAVGHGGAVAGRAVGGFFANFWRGLAKG